MPYNMLLKHVMKTGTTTNKTSNVPHNNVQVVGPFIIKFILSHLMYC